ncbi:MAG: hypothetical protein K2N35_00020 [Muribaculaceae bacterium]|nr:hypothetical protein [Muribaculaceae bacterium]
MAHAFCQQLHKHSLAALAEVGPNSIGEGDHDPGDSHTGDCPAAGCLL